MNDATTIRCVLCETVTSHEGARWRPRSSGYVCATCSSKCACGTRVEEPTHFDATTSDPMCAACVARRLANVTLRRAIEAEAVKKFADRLATSLEQLAMKRVRSHVPDAPSSLAEIEVTTFLYELVAVVRKVAEEEADA